MKTEKISWRLIPYVLLFSSPYDRTIWIVMNLVYQNQDMNQNMVDLLFTCLWDEEESKTRQSILERTCFYWDYQI
jgi:hypothetical protein